MKFTKGLLVVMLLLPLSAFAQAVPQIIFDTDIGPDYDDVGALTMLHAYEDQGRCKLLATIASNRYDNIGPVIDVINTYFKKPNIPIAVVRGPAPEMKCSQKWDSVIVKNYPHDLKSNSLAEDPVDLYRKILSKSADQSVTIVTVGFLTNMSNLLQSKGDKHSTLNGVDLVRAKVKRLVAMAGWFPEGKEFNIKIDAKASMDVAATWPTEIIFSGFEVGVKIRSGLPLIQSNQQNSPVKDVFAISMALTESDRQGRNSWDQTAVLIAVEGAEKFYELVPGKIICLEDGTNRWDAGQRGHFYVKEKVTVAEVERLINALMLYTPAKK